MVALSKKLVDNLQSYCSEQPVGWLYLSVIANVALVSHVPRIIYIGC